jgi:hypothetical protein
MAELAFWQPIHMIADIPGDEASQRQLSGADVMDRLQRKCASRLPHQVGRMFHTTIMTCLGFKSATVQMNSYEMQKYFQENVRTKLETAVGRV